MNLRRYIPLLILLLLILIPFNRVFSHGEYVNGVSPFVSYLEPFASELPDVKPDPAAFSCRKDGFLQTLPSKLFTQNELREGRWPLWNPYIFSGTPHQADMYSQLFSVTDTPLLLLFNVDAALTVAILLKLLLLASGMYFLALRLGAKWEFAIISSVVMCFSFLTLQWLQIPAFLSTTLYLPWMFIAWDEFLSTSRRRWVCLVAILGGLAILGGQMQIWITIWFILFLYTLFFRREVPVMDRIGSLVPLIGASITAAAIGWVQIYPGMEFTRLTYEGEHLTISLKLSILKHALASGGVVSMAKNFLRLFAPYVYYPPDGTQYAIYQELILYLGFLSPAILFAFWRRERPPVINYLWWVSLVSLLIMAFHIITEGILGMIPFTQFMSLKRVGLLLFYFHMALLVPLAMQYVLSQSETVLKRKLGIGIIAGIIIAIGYLVLKWMTGVRQVDSMVLQGYPQQFVMFYLLSILIGGLYLFLLYSGSRLKKHIPILLLILFFLEMWNYSSHQIDTTRIGVEELSRINPFPGTAMAEMRGADERVVRFSADKFLIPNTGILLGLKDVQGYNPLNKHEYRQLYESIFASDFGNQRKLLSIEDRPLHPEWLKALYNVGWILNPHEEDADLLVSTGDEETSVVYSGPVIDLERFSLDLPTVETSQSIAYVYDEWVSVEIEELAELYSEDEFRPDKIVYITGEPLPDDVDKILVFPQNNYPGWKVLVDGEEVETFTVQATMLGIAYDGGEHEIELIFDPPRFRIGLIVTIIALALSLLAFSAGFINVARAHRARE